METTCESPQTLISTETQTEFEDDVERRMGTSTVHVKLSSDQFNSINNSIDK